MASIRLHCWAGPSVRLLVPGPESCCSDGRCPAAWGVGGTVGRGVQRAEQGKHTSGSCTCVQQDELAPRGLPRNRGCLTRWRGPGSRSPRPAPPLLTLAARVRGVARAPWVASLHPHAEPELSGAEGFMGARAEQWAEPQSDPSPVLREKHTHIRLAPQGTEPSGAGRPRLDPGPRPPDPSSSEGCGRGLNPAPGPGACSPSLAWVRDGLSFPSTSPTSQEREP